MKTNNAILFICLLIGISSCQTKNKSTSQNSSEAIDNRIPVYFDTDCNNELDDQHALAYLLFNTKTFNVLGVSVNATSNGGNVKEHYKEAERIMKFCKADGKISLTLGANANFVNIKDSLHLPNHDGYEAINSIIETAKNAPDTIVLLPVGKLTNIALAIKKAPEIKNKIKIVWLGSNYPVKGEYNMENDMEATRYILSQNVHFEMVTVRWPNKGGATDVNVTPADMEKHMPGTGPKLDTIIGRHGNSFTCFGDYSIDLFHHIDLHGDNRPLYDAVAVAILKNPEWGESKTIPAPRLDGENWIEQPDNERKIIVWENFNKEKILADFFNTMKRPELVE